MNTNTTFVEQWLEATNRHDFDRLLSLYDEKPGDDRVSDDEENNGKHKHLQMFKRRVSAFPDIQLEIVKSVSEGNNIAVLCVGYGTHKDKYQNIPPSGKKITMNGTIFFELRNGKITDEIQLWDGAALLRQMGLLPEIQIQ